MYNGRRLAHCPVDGRVHGRHVRVRGDHDGRSMRLGLGLELTGRHCILVGMRLMVGVGIPLLHVLLHLRRIGRRVGRTIVLWMVVGGVGIVVHRRMGLRGHVVLMVLLAPARVVRPGRRDVRARHHGGRCDVAFTESAPAGTKHQPVRQRGGRRRRRSRGLERCDRGWGEMRAEVGAAGALIYIYLLGWWMRGHTAKFAEGRWAAAVVGRGFMASSARHGDEQRDCPYVDGGLEREGLWEGRGRKGGCGGSLPKAMDDLGARGVRTGLSQQRANTRASGTHGQ